MDRGMISIAGGRIVVTPAADGTMLGGTVWMSKHQIADLFECFVSKVGSNILSILKRGIFDESRVCHLCRYKDGSSVELYNLEMIAALAFRINSQNADLFRRWLMERAVKPRQPISVFIPMRERMLPS